MERMAKVFISYSRGDIDAAEYIASELREHGADVFIDTHELTAGEDFVGRLGKEVSAADVVVLLLSPNSTQSRWVKAEINWAFIQEKRILPILLEETDLTEFFFLVNIDRIDFTRWHQDRHVEAAVNKLLRALDLERDRPVSAEEDPDLASHTVFDLADLNRRMQTLEKIAEEIRFLEASPLYAYRVRNNYYPVPGEGSPLATIVLVGEAPGKQEAESGRPFTGASGKVLDEQLESIGLKRENIFITNIIKDRLPDNRDPLPEEISIYAPFLDRQLDVLKPRVVVALGRYAMGYLFKRFGLDVSKLKISKIRGQVYQARANYGDVSLVPLYHPAVALYRPAEREVMLQDVQVLRQFIPTAR